MISDYQTKQRNCQLRWDIFNPDVDNKITLDIGCAQGWFTKKSLESGAVKSIGVDKSNYNWKGAGEFIISDEFIKVKADVAFLLSVPTDIKVIEYIRNNGIQTIYFEPFLDSEEKSLWSEETWLQRFREFGYDFQQVGISERDRNMYILKYTPVHMIINDGCKCAIKKNVKRTEINFYENVQNEYILPYEIKGKDLILPWADTTFRISGLDKHLPAIEKAINAIHSDGFIHGDIRISNFVIHDGKIFIIDFENVKKGKSIKDSGVGKLKNKRGYNYIKKCVEDNTIRYNE